MSVYHYPSVYTSSYLYPSIYFPSLSIISSSPSLSISILAYPSLLICLSVCLLYPSTSQFLSTMSTSSGTSLFQANCFKMGFYSHSTIPTTLNILQQTSWIPFAPSLLTLHVFLPKLKIELETADTYVAETNMPRRKDMIKPAKSCDDNSPFKKVVLTQINSHWLGWRHKCLSVVFPWCSYTRNEITVFSKRKPIDLRTANSSPKHYVS